MSKFVIIIISCRRDIKEHAALRELSLIGLKIPYFFLVGEPNQKNMFRVVDDTLYIRCEDTYEYLTHKVYYALQYVYQTYLDLKGVWKADIDSYFDAQRFPKYLERVGDHHYAGHVLRPVPRQDSDVYFYRKNKFPTRTIEEKIFLGRYFSGGKGYYLSREAISHILEYVQEEGGIKELYEDKMIGDILRIKGLIKNDNDLFQIKSKKKTYSYSLFESYVDFEDSTFICGMSSQQVKKYLEKKDQIKSYHDFTNFVRIPFQ